MTGRQYVQALALALATGLAVAVAWAALAALQGLLVAAAFLVESATK